jgi:hypothetical protein
MTVQKFLVVLTVESRPFNDTIDEVYLALIKKDCIYKYTKRAQLLKTL